LEPRRRSLADRDTLPLSLRRLGVERSSGRQAPPLPQWEPLSISYTLLFLCPVRSVLASFLSLVVPGQYKALRKAEKEKCHGRSGSDSGGGARERGGWLV